MKAVKAVKAVTGAGVARVVDAMLTYASVLRQRQQDPFIESAENIGMAALLDDRRLVDLYAVALAASDDEVTDEIAQYESTAARLAAGELPDGFEFASDAETTPETTPEAEPRQRIEFEDRSAEGGQHAEPEHVCDDACAQVARVARALNATLAVARITYDQAMSILLGIVATIGPERGFDKAEVLAHLSKLWDE